MKNKKLAIEWLSIAKHDLGAAELLYELPSLEEVKKVYEFAEELLETILNKLNIKKDELV